MFMISVGGAEPGAQRGRRRCAGAPRRSCAPPATSSTGGSRARTAALTSANRALQEEIEHRKRVETELDQQTRAPARGAAARQARKLGARRRATTGSSGPTSCTRSSGSSPARICRQLRRLSAARPSRRPRARARGGQPAIRAGQGLSRRAADRAAERRDPPPAELRRGDQGRDRPRGADARHLPRRHRAQAGRARARAHPRAAGAGAEDGGARPAHRRHRARLQQPPDDRQRPRRDAAARARRAAKALRAHRRDRGRGAARREPDAPAPDVLAAPAAQPGRRSTCRQRVEAVRDMLGSSLRGNITLDARHPGRPVAGRGRRRRVRACAGQHRGQCARRHAARAAPSPCRRATCRPAPDEPASRPASTSRLSLDRHRRRHSAGGDEARSSIRSSPPRRWARAPGSACRRSTASPTSRAAAVSVASEVGRGTTITHLAAAQPRPP